MAMELDSPVISSVGMNTPPTESDSPSRTPDTYDSDMSDADDPRLRALDPPQSHDYAPGTYACPQFFRSVGEDSFRCEPLTLRWDYEQRREAQRVLPFLYVGPTSAARDVEFLKREGITLVLAVRSRFSSHALTVNADKAASLAGIQSDSLAVHDYYEFITMFPEAIRRINNHVCSCSRHAESPMPKMKKVLVFCETGNERSACLVTAYLMVMLGLSMYGAYNHVQNRRLCVNIDLPVREILRSFDALLCAQRDVFRLSQTSPAVDLYGTNSTKRSHASFQAGIECQDTGNVANMDMDEDGRRLKRRNSGQIA